MKAADMYKVEGYGAIVTGGASGLGLAYVEVLAENGARVTMLDIDPAGIEREVGRLRGLGYNVDGKVVDVTNRAAMHRAFDEVVSKYGRLDVVFANAGIDPGPGFIGFDRKTRSSEGAIENYADARWDKVIDTNLNSVFTTIKAAAKHMKPRNSGRIIITTSVAAFVNETAIGEAFIWWQTNGAILRKSRPAWKAPRSQSLATTRKLLPIRAGGTIDRREAENPAEEVVGEPD